MGKYKMNQILKRSNVLYFHFFVFVDIHKIRKFTIENFCH